MPSAPAFAFTELRNELRVKPRAGQPLATGEDYNSSVERAKISRKEHLQGWDISHAQYEEAEFFAEKWMREHQAHNLDFGEKENHLIRGQLMDALEDEFAFFLNRDVPRVWREAALKAFISTVRNEFKNRPTLAEPTAPRKRARYEDYSENRAKKSKTPQPAKKSLLAFSKVIVAHDEDDTQKHVVYLRDVIRNGEKVLNADFNLNISALSFSKLLRILEDSDIVDFKHEKHTLHAKINEGDTRVVDDRVQFSHALEDGMPTDGLYYFYIIKRLGDDDEGGVENNQHE